MSALAPTLKQRFFDTNGAPLVGGKLYSYAAGTTTPKATYTDESLGAANANPIILDANGEANVWLDSGITNGSHQQSFPSVCVPGQFL